MTCAATTAGRTSRRSAPTCARGRAGGPARAVPGGRTGPALPGPDPDADARLESALRRHGAPGAPRHARRRRVGASPTVATRASPSSSRCPSTTGPGRPRRSPAPSARASADAHEQRYGYRIEGEPVEVVALRVTALIAGERPALTAPPADPSCRASRREVRVQERVAAGGRRPARRARTRGPACRARDRRVPRGDLRAAPGLVGTHRRGRHPRPGAGLMHAPDAARPRRCRRPCRAPWTR